MSPLFWADLLLVLHFLYVLAVLLPLPLILLGGFFSWSWVRNFWFRLIHIILILAVAVPDLLGIPCPLTVWEQDLRWRAGEAGYEGTFMGYWLDRLLYYDFSARTFTVIYVSFALLVLGLFFLIPPRLRSRIRKNRQKTSE